MNMIVEFKMVKASKKEAFDNESLENLGTTPSFFNKEDYITEIFVEIDDVLDFGGGKVCYNDKIYECTYIRFIDCSSYAILITPTEFKKILEYVRNIKIKTGKEILNAIRNENNTTGI